MLQRFTHNNKLPSFCSTHANLPHSPLSHLLIARQPTHQGGKRYPNATGYLGGYEADVIKAATKGDILTVQLAYRNTGNENIQLMYGIQYVYYIDEKEKKKYHVLRDSQNVYLGSPNLLNDINARLMAGGKTIVWFKFPAPPIDTTKISLIVPEVLPFEDLPISQ